MSLSPPRPKGPPLNALRAFEAAARLGGFRAAAQELSVTPGAISQHIKALEDWVGAALFVRRSQGVVLTELGAGALDEFTAAFDMMGLAVGSLRRTGGVRAINIAVLPSVAQLWLSPRLPGIRAALGGQGVSITALETPPNLRREVFDISLFIGTETGGKSEISLAPDVIFPVCTPDIAHRLQAPADLLREVWLFDTVWADDWDIWMSQVAPEIEYQVNGPGYSLYSIALAEAINGAGVLIGHSCLVEQALASGELVAPFGQVVRTGGALILQYSNISPGSDAVDKVVDMLNR